MKNNLNDHYWSERDNKMKKLKSLASKAKKFLSWASLDEKQKLIDDSLKVDDKKKETN